MATIRYAKSDDFMYVYYLCNSFIKDSGYTFPVNQDKVSDLIYRFTRAKGDNLALIVLTDDEDIPYGMVAGTVEEIYFSDTRIAQEIVWYIDPSMRGLRDSINLLKAFELWAKWQECDVVRVSNLENLNGPKVEKFYNKFGYSKVESAFIKELN